MIYENQAVALIVQLQSGNGVVLRRRGEECRIVHLPLVDRFFFFFAEDCDQLHTPPHQQTTDTRGLQSVSKKEYSKRGGCGGEGRNVLHNLVNEPPIRRWRIFFSSIHK